MNRLKKLSNFIFFCFILHVPSVCCQEFSQKLEDSLAKKSFEDLSRGFIENYENPEKSILYANTYLKKAKLENEKNKIAKAYLFHTYIFKNQKRVLDYCDSLLSITLKKKSSKYPILAYLAKGDYYYETKNYKKSLDNYILAQKQLQFYEGGLRFDLTVNNNIGLLKSRLGQDKEALEIFKENWSKILLNDNGINNRLEYMYCLSDSYVRNKLHDSSSIYNYQGIKEALEKNDTTYYNLFVLNEGINNYKIGEYQSSIDSLSKSLKYFKQVKSHNDLIELYYYLGSNYHEIDNKNLAKYYFKKVDSIFQESGNIHPDFRNAYEKLINYSKLENDSKEELFYIKRLLSVDSILNTEYKYLNNKIVSEFDTPKLISEKQRIIGNLKNDKKKYLVGILSLVIMLVVIATSFVFYKNKQIAYKKRFESLLASYELQTNTKTPDHIQSTPQEPMNISQPLIEEILKKLEVFEKNHDFLENSISIQSLAKNFNTNARYLSKIINTYKKHTFSNYLNELRINYITNQLRKDKKLQAYTIKAIAHEIGYNNAQSFSNAFYKRHGIYPSYYIKNLNQTD